MVYWYCRCPCPMAWLLCFLKVLPPAPSGTVWKAGDVVETAWSIRANHGGGYQYRLCPSNETLTEECFQARPIPFAEKMALRWENGTQQMIPGTCVCKEAALIGWSVGWMDG
eukprot:m.78800 g.78800  ORF g.78800 m.78800 type:complete len:112 (+) comp14598_c0_seq5:73-408(+)